MRKTLLIPIAAFLMTFAIFYLFGIPKPLMRLLLEIPPYENWYRHQLWEAIQSSWSLAFSDPINGKDSVVNDVGERIGRSILLKTSLMLGCVSSIFVLLICIMSKYCNTEKSRLQTKQENPLKDNKDECKNP